MEYYRSEHNRGIMRGRKKKVRAERRKEREEGPDEDRIPKHSTLRDKRKAKKWEAGLDGDPYWRKT